MTEKRPVPETIDYDAVTIHDPRDEPHWLTIKRNMFQMRAELADVKRRLPLRDA